MLIIKLDFPTLVLIRQDDNLQNRPINTLHVSQNNFMFTHLYVLLVKRLNWNRNKYY